MEQRELFTACLQNSAWPVEAAQPLEDLMETKEFPQCCHS